MPNTATPDVEYRYCEMRLEGERTLVGTAMSYGDVATMPWGEKERFEPGAFGDLGNRDIILNVQHDRGRPIARTGGGGLKVSDNGTRLEIRAELPETREADDTLQLVQNRVLRGLSIEFNPRSDKLENDVRVITRADLNGIAVVDKPAYKQSRVDAREETETMNEDTLKQIREAVAAAIQENRAADKPNDESLVRAMTDSVEKMVEKRMEATNAELEELRAKTKKMEEDKKEEEDMRKKHREEAMAEAEARADMLTAMKPILPEGFETRGKSVKDIMVAAVGDEVKNAQDRSEDYLLAKAEDIMARRSAAPNANRSQVPPHQPAQPAQNREDGAMSDSFNVIRFIEQRNARKAAGGA